MSNLDPKNVLDNWEIPFTTARGNRYVTTPNDFIIIKRMLPEVHGVKGQDRAMMFKKHVVENLFKEQLETLKEGENIRIALSFQEDKVFAIFNPKPTLESYMLSKALKELTNKTVVDKIFETLKLDEKEGKYFLKPHFWTSQNGMDIYILTPQDYKTKQPILEAEKNGDLKF